MLHKPQEYKTQKAQNTSELTQNTQCYFQPCQNHPAFCQQTVICQSRFSACCATSARTDLANHTIPQHTSPREVWAPKLTQVESKGTKWFLKCTEHLFSLHCAKKNKLRSTIGKIYMHIHTFRSVTAVSLDFSIPLGMTKLNFQIKSLLIYNSKM